MVSNRENVLSSLNSSIAPLGSGAIFTGTGEKVYIHDSAIVSVYTDQNGTIYFEQSPDGINWDVSDAYSVLASIEETNSVIITRQFFRVRYVNSISAQTFLRIQTLFGAYANISIENFIGAPGLTNAQLRASPVPVSGTVNTGLSQPLTDTQIRATALPVSGPLTDTQLRLTPVPVSGTFYQATQPVSGTVSATVSGTVTATAQPGVDIGDVTINNASGASAVNIQDGGNSITVDDLSNAGGVQGAITVTGTASEAKVGGSALANRKNLTILNNGSATIYWGYDSSVTDASGTPLNVTGLISLNVGPGTHVYLIATTGSHNVRITESA